MNLRRYDTYIVHYDIGDFIEEEERVDGEHTNANDALNIITAQKNRIAELEAIIQTIQGYAVLNSNLGLEFICKKVLEKK